MRQVEENLKAGTGVEKPGGTDGSPASHTFANLFKNHMAPNWPYPMSRDIPPSKLQLPPLYSLLWCLRIVGKQSWVCAGIQLFVSCEAIGKSLKLPDLQFPCLYNGDNNGIHIL